MPQVCILTDSTAQFLNSTFPGHELVNVLPFHVKLGNGTETDSKDIRLSAFPHHIRNHPSFQVCPPSPEEFRQAYTHLSQRYREIVTILLSAHISSALESAKEAEATVKCSATIHILDTQTTSVGMGFLAQSAAQAASQGCPGAEIARRMRGMIPHVYTALCIQGLTYLAHAGHLDPAQAIIGEMLGITPMLILESGRLTPVQKVRNARHLLDLFHEFVSEFPSIRHIALIQGISPFDLEIRQLRERINGQYPSSIISEHALNASLTALIGPRSLGVIVIEQGYEG
jgi:DegV family protein with EDD domain